MSEGVIPSLTSWDWFILTAVVISTGLGVWRGMIRTIFGLAAWILGLLGAPIVGLTIGERFGVVGVPMWVLYVLAFILTFIMVRLIGSLFLKGARSVGLAGVDRLLGAALGVARAGLVVLVAAVIAYRMGFSHSVAWQAAVARPLLETMVEIAQPWLPAVKKA
jgi:membrane protein required for colicin V production